MRCVDPKRSQTVIHSGSIHYSTEYSLRKGWTVIVVYSNAFFLTVNNAVALNLQWCNSSIFVLYE